MRETTVRGIDDDVRLDLGSDVGIVAAVIEVADAADGLIYKATLTGGELIALIKKEWRAWQPPCEIKENNRYEITAYDW